MDINNPLLGHALDALVAEKVMGQTMLTVEQMQAEADRTWKVQPQCRVFAMGFEARGLSFGGFGFRNIVKPYSTDIAAAWEVVEKLELIVGPNPRGGWIAQNCWDVPLARFSLAETAPLAICRLALALKTEGQ